MSKKNQRDTKKSNSLHKYFNKNSQADDKNLPQSFLKTQSKKKPCPNLNQNSNRDERSSSLSTAAKKTPLFMLAKGYDTESILFNCSKLAQLAIYLQSRVDLQKKVVKNVIKKYVQANSRSLWSSKYAPKDCSELFNFQAGKKIKHWLYAFFEYKNKICEESDSFLNDIEEEKSCKIYNNIRQNQWQLLALVVRGRPGTGKSSAVRAIAHEMQLDLQQCGNDYNQTKYLKEKNESTQSESVKTAISRKVKLQKNAQMITKFMSPVERQKTADTKKTQMIHNVGEIFPVTQSHKFYGELNRCIQLSKIPFIMTDSCDKLPKQCEGYDVIEYQYGQSELIQKILWVIYHVENILCMDTLKQVQKHQIYQQIKSQIGNLSFSQKISLSKIHQICSLFNYRLDYIFAYLQHNNNLEWTDLSPLFLQKYKQYTKQKLLDQIKLIDVQQHMPQIKIVEYKRSDEAPSTQDSQQQLKNSQFYQSFRALKLACAEDLIKSKDQTNLNESFIKNIEIKQDFYSCVPNKAHHSVKKSLIQKINLEINSISDKFKSTLRVSELRFLPMLIKQKRSSRNSKASDEVYNKFFTQNQCSYIKKFGHLIRNQ